MEARKALRIGKIAFAAVLAVLVFTSGHAEASYRILHTFTGDDGAGPMGSPLVSDSTLYGMTSQGGAGDYGTIYRIGENGTGFQLLHSFSWTDGASPCGDLTISGTNLYGMTCESENRGVLFKIDTSGGGFQVLRDFTGGADDGAYPSGSLILSGSILYGMTMEGGAGDLGTIFRINTDGTGFQILHSFSGTPGDGAFPTGSLLLSGSTLYGMTPEGGSQNAGTIFRINANGQGYQILHHFTPDTSDGAAPLASLAQSGATLYGTAKCGGINDSGVIFKISQDGAGYQILHHFSDDLLLGLSPSGTPVIIGSALYGMTEAGGNNGMGTIYRINKDGAGYRILHHFPSSPSDGILPGGSLVLSGSKLYGMTPLGIDETVLGVLFVYDPPDSTVPILELLLLQ